MTNCEKCGTALVLVPPEQVLCDWCTKVGPQRPSRVRTKTFRYRVSTPEGGFETSVKEDAIRIAKEEAAEQGAGKVWVRDLRTGESVWPE
jgi:hypothetical protein